MEDVLSFSATLELVEEVEEVRGNKGMINFLPVLISFAGTSAIPHHRHSYYSYYYYFFVCYC